MYGKMQESGLTEIIPLMCTSALGDQYPMLLILSLPRVHGQGWLQQLTARWRATCFHPEFPPGSPSERL